MQVAEAYAAVKRHFNDNFTAARPSVPIAWPNIDFEFPNNSPFVRFSMQGNIGTQASLGDISSGQVVSFRRQGVIIIQCFGLASTGDSEALAIADDALKIFEGRHADSVWFRNFRPVDVGPDGAWYQINVTGDYVFDTIKTGV